MIIAVVKSIEEGAKGSYAVAFSKHVKEGSITFALEPPVWTEGDYPAKDVEVVLFNLRKQKGGWRAEKARYRQPSDENPV